MDGNYKNKRIFALRFNDLETGLSSLLSFISVAGSERQIFGGGEDDRFRGQTEAGPDSPGDGHPCARWTPEPCSRSPPQPGDRWLNSFLPPQANRC